MAAIDKAEEVRKMTPEPNSILRRRIAELEAENAALRKICEPVQTSDEEEAFFVKADKRF